MQSASVSLNPRLPPRAEPVSWGQELERSLREDRKLLLGLARSQLRDHQLAEDVVQEAALAAWKDVGRFEGRSSMRTWLVGILRFKILDALRERQRHAVWSSVDIEQEMADMNEEGWFDAHGRWAEAPQAWWHTKSHPGDSVQQQQLLRQLHVCLDRLPERSSQVFLMREYLGFDTAEIAQRTGLLPGNIRVILMRSRSVLRACLEWHLVNGLFDEV